MSRADDVRNILVLEEFANRAREEARAIRDRMDAEARHEYDTEGVATTWRLRDIATVSLSLTRESVTVSDSDKLLEWVRHRHPDEVETVTTVQVRPSFVTALIGAVDTADGFAVVEGTGEIVPGLAVRPGGQPRSLSIKAEPAVKAAVAERVAAILPGVFGTVEAAPPPPAIDAEFSASGDPFALVTPEADDPWAAAEPTVPADGEAAS